MTTENLDNFCVWYWIDCKKAMPQKHKYCSGIPKQSCFAYLSVAELEKREKERNLEESIRTGK